MKKFYFTSWLLAIKKRLKSLKITLGYSSDVVY